MPLTLLLTLGVELHMIRQVDIRHFAEARHAVFNAIEEGEDGSDGDIKCL